MQIPHEIFNAACICAGTNPDRKTFYKTIIITEDSRLVSSDGAMLYVSNPLFDLTPRAVMFHDVLPSKCLLVELRENTAVGFDKTGKEVAYISLSTIKIDFPDWKNRVVWNESPESSNYEVRWNIEVLKKIVKMFDKEKGVKYFSGGPEGVARITGNHGTVWAMPCKIV